jgi:hypothetical protein
VLLQQFGNDLVLLNEQPLNEVGSEDGDVLLAGIIDTFPMLGYWRQPFCNRQTPAHFPACDTKVSKTLWRTFCRTLNAALVAALPGGTEPTEFIAAKLVVLGVATGSPFTPADKG